MMMHDDDDDAAKDVLRMPSLNVGGAQRLRGRSRACAFWISSIVPHGTRYLVDSTQLVTGWEHNPARDEVPHDCVLVVISPADAEHVRKAMATWTVLPHPAHVAARIIDDCCRRDPALAASLRWTVLGA